MNKFKYFEDINYNAFDIQTKIILMENENKELKYGLKLIKYNRRYLNHLRNKCLKINSFKDKLNYLNKLYLKEQNVYSIYSFVKREAILNYKNILLRTMIDIIYRESPAFMKSLMEL